MPLLSFRYFAPLSLVSLARGRRLTGAAAAALGLLLGLTAPTAGRAAAPPPARCQVKVTGIPPAQRHFYALRVHLGPKVQLDPKTGIARLTVPPEGLRLDLAGPRHNSRYTGGLRLDPKDCRDGPVVLEAHPRPARLEFLDLKSGQDELVVSCVKGCSAKRRQWKKFRIPLGRGESSITVTLRLEAPGHLPRDVVYRLQPGRNAVRAKLTAVE